ncbi:MAG: hypothetical protein E4H01_05325 [Lysobacterales bacterium]|nr:MAG: hypothetical protein E4H01_05325 [Xanthomonadales bacterium]
MRDAKEAVSFAEQRFQDQSVCLPLWQTIAENFYPERSDFVISHTNGSELAGGLASSYPILIRRDLGNSFAAMLRDGQFFEIGTEEDNTDTMGKQWLDYVSNLQYKKMQHRSANFRRATKEGDHDYATFGQTVLSVEPNKSRKGFLYRGWHLRDCAWWDGADGQVAGLVRKWSPNIYELRDDFKEDELHPSVAKKLNDSKKMFDRSEMYHFDIPGYMWNDGEFAKWPWVSVWIDKLNVHLVRVTPKNQRTYIVPRFQTISGTPYAYSPATVVGLPDARTLQAMTHTLLEAGERAARPPLLATENIIRGDANLFSDGITFISEDYDWRSGAPLEPIKSDKSGFPFGIEMAQSVIEVLQQAFYVDKIDLPEGREMTAYEFRERMKQLRRQNLPLFAPLEHEYNGQLCELTFQIGLEYNMFGSPYDIPQSLRDKEVVFKFESPLTQSEEEQKVQLFAQVSDMLASAAQFDPDIHANIDFDEALRDSVDGIGAPSKWLADVKLLQERRERAAQTRSEMAAAGEQVAA